MCLTQLLIRSLATDRYCVLRYLQLTTETTTVAMANEVYELPVLSCSFSSSSKLSSPASSNSFVVKSPLACAMAKVFLLRNGVTLRAVIVGMHLCTKYHGHHFIKNLQNTKPKRTIYSSKRIISKLAPGANKMYLSTPSGLDQRLADAPPSPPSSP